MTSARYLHVVFLRHVNTLLHRKDSPERRASIASDPGRGRRSSIALPPVSKKIYWGIWIFSFSLFWIVVLIIAKAITVFNSLLNI